MADGTWDTDMLRAWIGSYEEAHHELFQAFRAAGWRPSEDSPRTKSVKWASSAGRFLYNERALQIELELGGLSFERHDARGSPLRFVFAPGETFANLEAAANDYDLDVFDIVEERTCFPVGEGMGCVLFVGETGRSAMIDQSLCSYARAANPFLLLDVFLMGVPADGRIESEAVAQGTRVTGRPNT